MNAVFGIRFALKDIPNHTHLSPANDMPLQKITLLFSFFLLSVGLYASGHFAFTAEARRAYDLATSLRLDEARQQIALLQQNDPHNLTAYHLENYIDFFTIFINEDKEEFQRLEKNKAARIQKLKSGDSASPYYLFAQAEVKLQWALARLKFEEYFTALLEIKSAYKLLEKNQRRFPDFVANQKSLAIMHAMIGTVPDQYRWGVKLLSGMEGTIDQGRRELEEVIDYARRNDDFIFGQEAVVLYAFLMLHLNNDSAAAWEVIRSGQLDPTNNPLACFALANLAMRTGRNAEAIRLLENRPKGSEYHPFHYLDYTLGLAKLRRLDPDADVYLLRYVRNFKGQNYIKEAYQKLAWHQLLQNNVDGYKKHMTNCQQYGHAMVEGDKNALREAKSRRIPHPDLLKARLLFDGGYYQKGYELLQQKKATHFDTLKDQLEWYYRLGRLTHRLHRYPEAIRYYQTTINEGKDQPWFYACNAALQTARIHELQQEYQLARTHYKQCLSIHPDQYRNGLHQQAKAGLNRLKKK